MTDSAAIATAAGPTQTVPHEGRRRLRRPPIWLILVILVAAVVGGWFAFGRDLRDRYFVPRNWGVVEPGKIFRSGQVSKELIRETLQKNQINAIIFMSNDKPNRPDVQAEAAAAADMGIARYHYNLDGNGTGDPQKYIDAVTTLVQCEKEGKRVLVHCQTGAQRTGGVVALYRTLVQGKSGQEAFAELRQYGHDPEDNEKMIPYLNKHMKEFADALAQRGVIAKPPEKLPVIGP